MTTVVLVTAAFGTAVISGTIGMAGGILLFVIMSVFFPPAVLIPVHGVVQLGSNSVRTLIFFRNIKASIAILFGVGAVIGVLIGSRILITLPEDIFQIVLGIFILVMAWMPRIKAVPRIKMKFFFVGGVSTFLSLFIGATGPFIAPFFLRENLRKEEIVATKAACQVFIHFFKIVAFSSVLGFSFQPYAGLLVGMLLASFAGNWCGKKILKAIPQRSFIWIFRAVISILAVRMLLAGIQN